MLEPFAKALTAATVGASSVAVGKGYIADDEDSLNALLLSDDKDVVVDWDGFDTAVVVAFGNT